jgi:4-aminobutyrate aminotransferase
LEELGEESHLIGDVRGLGLMIGVEFVKDKATKEKAKKETEQVMLESFKRGLMLLPCGDNSMRFSPPLILTEPQADTAFELFAEALKEVEGNL